jgi:glycosyltransferase involved in cell wall biosynthesis
LPELKTTMHAATSRMAHHAITSSVTGVASRIARSLPAPVRAGLRRIVEWPDRRPMPSLEGWSRPLVGALSGAPLAGDILMATAETCPGLDIAESISPHMPTSVSSRKPGMPVLRCLVVTGALDVSGVDEVAAFLARRLSAYDLHTAAMHARSDPSPGGEPRGRLGRMLQAQGVEVREADAAGARRWIEQWRPDVISAHHTPHWVLNIAQDLGVPYVENLHGMHDLFNRDWRAEADRSTKISAIVAVSELVRQQYLAGNPEFPSNQIVTIPNGVDSQQRSVYNRRTIRSRLGLTDEYLFVSLARHSLQKNSYGLVTAFGELARRHSDAHLVIAGRLDDVRYYRQVLRLRENLPCRDHIHMRGNTAAPAALLAAADGFVLDSFFEGWSLASMEALFAGVPAVLSDVGGAREQISDDSARGYLVPNPLGDPLKVNWESMGAARYWKQINQIELMDAMKCLIVNRDYYLRNREQLAADSARRFSAESCLTQHAAILRTAAISADVCIEEGL